MKDSFRVKVEEDGTTSFETGSFSSAIHLSADKFLRSMQQLLGGTTTKQKSLAHHHHHHDEEHAHDHDHE